MGQSAPRTLLLLLLAGLLEEARGGFPNTISIGKRHPVAPGGGGEKPAAAGRGKGARAAAAARGASPAPAPYRTGREMRERCPGCWGGCCSPRDRREAGVRLRAGPQSGLRSGGVKRSAVPSTCGRGSRQAAGVRVKNLGFCAFFFFPLHRLSHREPGARCSGRGLSSPQG